MTQRPLVFITAAAVIIAFAAAAFYYRAHEEQQQKRTATEQSDVFVRPHAPVIGPPDAPVTIVEFFDPSCEACRAFYPHVKKILADHPKTVRLVLRYAPFHEGSDEAVRILEAARLQGKFEPVLDALIEAQPAWAVHGAPNLKLAWDTARAAGLNIEQADKDKSNLAIDDVLRQDIQDLKAIRLNRTPTFFVNSRPLVNFGPEALAELVREEVEKAGQSSAVK